ncbi:TonB family protein [Saccharicrinis sp. FJH62]|uniref:TonB family protein n=1 Tax=Saccharicrinis sp. FJH62 TaxID=3344657 RepID=UPI0035D4ECCC
MNIVINYIVESALSLGILTLFYYGFLRNRNIPGFNRWFLLVALVFTSVLPLFHITLMRPEMATVKEPVYYGFMLDMVNIYGTLMKQNVVPAVQQHSGLHWLYMVGLALLVIRLIFALSKIGILQRKTMMQKVQGINLIQSEKIFQPFSFLNTVFVPKSFMQNDDIQSIIQHESIHVKQKHTFDLILLELVLLVQWFNPFVWLLRKAIVENHEFIADRAVLKGGVSVADYQRSLLYQVMGTRFDLGTGFSYSLTKKRFKMMKTKVNKKGVLISALLSLMLFSGIFFVAASELSVSDIVAPLISENNNDNSAATPFEQNDERQIFQIVEKMPEYPGGAKAMMEYLSMNIKYPTIAQEKGIQGRVYVNFIINTKGEVSDVKVVRGVDPALDAEAVRIVKGMPKWTPGEQRGKAVNVAYNLPINFALDNGKKEVTDGASIVAGDMIVKNEKIEKTDDGVIVSANVLDHKSNPIPGASVILKGNTLGTVTDMTGRFILKITSNVLEESDKALVISFVGLKSVTIDLESTGNKMDEIEVVAPGKPVVFQIVEKMPQFPGGEAAMMKYLNQNIHYPDVAKKNGIQGRVYINFIVEEDGSLSNIEVKRGVDPSLDKEAVRVIKAMPNWKPGVQRGKMVRVSFMLPINFVLNDGKSKSEKLTIIEDKPAVDENVVFQIVEQMPEFPGGSDAMMKFISDNLDYPVEAQKNKIQGKVYVNFIVEKDGTVDNIKVVRSVDQLLDKEAVRLIKAMPKWSPGKQRGKNVRVSYMLPINFLLS